MRKNNDLKIRLSLILVLLAIISWSSNISAQNLLATGISSQTQIRTIITNTGFTIQDVNLLNVNSTTLAGKKVLALFNGSQTWNGTQLFTTSQANDIVSFVQNGGYLYITSRSGYNNILSQFGVTTSGNDGGSTGFDWPLIELSATEFSSHQITQGLPTIVGDVGASFSVDGNWTIIGEESDGTDLLTVRNYGSGKIVLWYGQRSYRDPGSTGNVYETDITEGSNTQFYINIFNFFSNLNGINDVTEKQNIKFYPNPTSGILSIDYKDYKILKVSIFNSFGQPVLQNIICTNHKKFDLGGLSSGIYLIKVYNKNQLISTQTLIKE